MVLILILANLLRILFYASELGILGFIATFLFLIVLIPITIVISFKIFKKSKFSAILAPIIAFITLITFMTFPLQSLYIRVNHIMYKDLRCDFIIDYEKGKIDPARLNALIFDQFKHGYYVSGEQVGKAWNAGAGLMKE